MKDLDIVALARAEHRALLKQQAVGELKDPLGHAKITNQAGIVTVSITGFVSFYQYEELGLAIENAGDDLKSVVVNINSMGGSALAGVAIGNKLRGLDAEVTTVNESAAMSAAAIIFMSGKHRKMGEGGATLMFHEARGWIDVLEFGTAKSLADVDVDAPKAQAVDMLETIDEIIVGVMTKGTKLTAAKAKALMYDKKLKDGKTLSTEDALELGLATGVAGAGESESEPEQGPETMPAKKEEEDRRADDIELMASARAILDSLEVC